MSLLEKKQYFINKEKNVSTLKSLQSNSGDLTFNKIKMEKRKPKEKKNQINQKSYAAIMKIKKF